jgi:hypothetical protein
MKKFFFIICVMIIATGLQSQDYHKLIRTGTYWDQYTVVLPEMCYTTITRFSFADSDTILGGVAYRKNICYHFQAVNPGPLCPPFEIDDVPFTSYSFLREDTINRKVYIYCQGCFPVKDQLFYDFSLSVGDTLKSVVQTLYGEPLVLTSLDEVLLSNGETRKRFGFGNSPENLNYIEGIGGAQGLDAAVVPGIESYGGFFCITQNGINLWGNICNNYFVGLQEKKSEAIELYPNPAHDKLTIHLDGTNPDAELIISNLEGKEIIRTKLNRADNTISLSQVAPGVYIYQVTSGKVFRKDKIIIY